MNSKKLPNSSQSSSYCISLRVRDFYFINTTNKAKTFPNFKVYVLKFYKISFIQSGKTA